MAVAALMVVLMMFSIMNMLMLMLLSIVIVSMDVLISGMATHLLSPPFFILNMIPPQVRV
jgi:hypothetical protein